MRRLLRSPAIVPAAGAAVLLAVGALSGGFHGTRALWAPADAERRFIGTQTFLGQPLGIPQRNIRAWQKEATLCTVAAFPRDGQTLILGRLRPGATRDMARKELLDIISRNGLWMTGAGFELLPFGKPRVPGFIFGATSFAALGLIVAAWQAARGTPWRSLGFFLLKTALALATLCVVAIETGANGALFSWVFLLACLAALHFSIADQRRRCPVCLRRLALPQNSGSWSSVLEPVSTEFLCDQGHGALRLPEGRWKSIDDCWRELTGGRERT